ncbi:fungal-specific transcription factor domain-containing protein [Mycena alexandri]|uniref:Fungal-specific transcription factor domain-containing protein n=1 Tax=Mycena alexandri TaxID=1745969 RepID=A0AAD6WXB5_9AGAR|nr:fungal-specific transcription factor domain-containing protein [Mycena alexandri]
MIFSVALTPFCTAPMPKGSSTNPKVRKPYAPQACTICRAKKSKCDGVKPVCGSCEAFGRSEECAWGKGTAPRKHRTEAHFDALRKRVDSLQAYVDLMEALLAKCVCQDVTSHLQFRPLKPGDRSGLEEGEVENSDVSDSEIAQELTVPIQSLKIDDRSGGLLHHGITAPFRFAPSPVSQVKAVVEDDTSYVLLVDGVDASDAHPNIEWARHLPPEVALKRTEHDKVLDLTFKFSTMWCLRVVPSLFLRDMYRALSVPRSKQSPRTPYYSPMLHNALLAVAALYSDDPYLRDPKTRQYFGNAAKALLEAACQKPDVSLVNALAFLGTFYLDNGDRIQGELYSGMSSRICMTLGLGVDSTPWVEAGLITSEEMLGRNSVHWTIFSMDVCWALYFGHDFMGPPPDRRTISLPVVDTQLDQIPWFYAPSNIPPQPNLLTLIFLKSSTLFLIGHKIVSIVNGLAPDRKDAVHIGDQVAKIDLELHEFKSLLPPELDITPMNRTRSTAQRLMLHLQYWWCFLVLHRPFFNRRSQTVLHSDGQIDHVKLCIRAAENIMELLETWSSLYTLRLSPITLLQIVFSAGTIFLLRSLQATTNQRIAHASLKTSLTQVEQCVRYLHEMGRTWPCALRTGDILHTVLHDKLRPIIERRLQYKGVEIAPFLADSSSKDVSATAANANEPNSTTEPNPTTEPPPFDLPEWNPEYADIDWAQVSSDFATPPHIPAVPGDFSFAGDNMFPELDMSGFIIPTFDLFGAPDLWGQDLLGTDNPRDFYSNKIGRGAM